MSMDHNLTLDLKLDAEQLDKTIAQGIMALIDGPSRERALAKAIESIVKEDHYRSGGGSLLMQAFRSAVQQRLHQEIVGWIDAHPEALVPFRDALGRIGTKLLNESPEYFERELIGALSNILATALREAH